LNQVALLRSRARKNNHLHSLHLDEPRRPKADPILLLNQKILSLIHKSNRKMDRRDYLMALCAVDEAIELMRGLPQGEDKFLLESRLFTIKRNISLAIRRKSQKSAERFSSSLMRNTAYSF
jgi:hypothetical protein